MPWVRLKDGDNRVVARVERKHVVLIDEESTAEEMTSYRSRQFLRAGYTTFAVQLWTPVMPRYLEERQTEEHTP